MGENKDVVKEEKREVVKMTEENAEKKLKEIKTWLSFVKEGGTPDQNTKRLFYAVVEEQDREKRAKLLTDLLIYETDRERKNGMWVLKCELEKILKKEVI
jgi:hypothetical protein